LCTVERGILYKYNNLEGLDDLYQRKAAAALIYGCVLLDNVRRDDIPLEWTYMDHLDVRRLRHLVKIPLPADEPVLVCQGNRGCTWSATEVIPAPYGKGWCFLVDPTLSFKLDAVLDAVPVQGPPPRACIVLAFTPTLKLAHVPSQREILGFYDAELKRHKIPKGDFAGHLWVAFSPSGAGEDLDVLAQQFGATTVLRVGPSDACLAPGTNFWRDVVWPQVATGHRVFVRYIEKDNGKGLQLPELNALSKAHEMVVSVLTQGGAHHDMKLFLAMDSPGVRINVWENPIQALGIVRGEDKSVEDAWLPPVPGWSTGAGAGASTGTGTDGGGGSSAV
jgi:hypothetical protein